MVKIYVKLLRFNKGKSSEYAAVKCTISIKDAIAELGDDNFKSLIKFIMNDNIVIEEKFNGIKDTYGPHFIMGDLLIMPRFMFQRLKQYFTEKEIEHEVIHSSHISLDKLKAESTRKFGKLKVGLYANKVAVIDKIISDLQTDHGLIVKLDTGKGKSVIIAEVIRQMGLLTNIVVKDSTLQRQMFKDLHKTLELDCLEDCPLLSDGEPGGKPPCMSKSGLSKCNYIALLGGTKSVSNVRLLDSHKNYKILISIINSAKDKDLMFWSKFGLTIFDECHNYTSDKNSAIYQRSQTQYMLGLSATPTKRWNHMMLEHNIGKIVDFDPYIEDSVKLKGIVHKVQYRGPPNYTKVLKNSRGVMSVARMVKQFMEDESRNDLILGLIVDAVRKHKFGFVFAMRNDFLVELKTRLEAIAPEITSMVLCSDTSNIDKEITIKEVNVVFTNFSFSEGINLTHMRFLLTASPYKGNGRQITGRLLRDLKDDEIRYFYDIIDANTKLAQQFEEREQVYLQRGFEIKDYV